MIIHFTPKHRPPKKAHESGQPYGIINEGSENEPHALKENKRNNILNAITPTEAA